jgi:hypothetical protein
LEKIGLDLTDWLRIGRYPGGEQSRVSLLVSANGEVAMHETEEGRIVKTPTEVRQGERGPSVLLVLVVSVVLAVLILAGVWMIFFRT